MSDTDFRIEVNRTWYYVKSDESEAWHTDPHRAETQEMEYDSDAEMDYDSPVEWAVTVLRNDASPVATPWMAGFPSLEPSGSPIPDTTPDHWWMSGTAADNYTDEESEWSIRLLSPGWTEEMRAEVFRRVTKN